ncbi:acyltransferase family protein [Olivibacter sitiensis]|uniref:acyltransferase family protein n=1 Tax=Olivibacter sitiensis TaxID=376470 RepID=UPI0004872634|nr:DUF5009 domain-containing protein [Olivibacter sitiensis]
MKQRYYSLDVFRGATVALMILVNNPGSWSHIFAPLAHAQWHGATPTDMVFPFFLFAVGNAMAFVIPRLQQAGATSFYKKVIKRTLLIFLIGLLLNWFPFLNWQGDELVFKPWVDPNNPTSGIRILGVFQRIAIAYFFASLMAYYFKPKSVFFLSLLILMGYWALCAFLGGADPYTLQGWFGTAIDLKVLGVAHMYKGEGVPFDPEGIASTLPSIVQVAFGYLVGHAITTSKNNLTSTDPKGHIYRLLSTLMVVGFIAMLIGLFWDLGFPINKKIWSSSYVVYTTSLAIMSLGCLIWYIEVKDHRGGWTRFFDVFGKNPLFIFVISAIIPKTMWLIRIENGIGENGDIRYTNPLSWFYTEVCAKVPAPPEVGSLLYAICFLCLLWSICYWLDRKKIYIKV